MEMEDASDKGSPRKGVRGKMHAVIFEIIDARVNQTTPLNSRTSYGGAVLC